MTTGLFFFYGRKHFNTCWNSIFSLKKVGTNTLTDISS